MPGNRPLITKTASGRVKILAVKTAPKGTLNVLKARNLLFKNNNSRANFFLFLLFFLLFFTGIFFLRRPF